MTQPKAPDSDRESGSNNRYFGTQVSSFGSDPEPPTPSSGTLDPATPTAIETVATQKSAYGTQFAAPIDQQARLAPQNRPAPLEERFAAVNQTRRADPLELARIAKAADSGASQQVIASKIRSITESEKTLILQQRSGDSAQTAGKSTWDLRIPRRDVQGQISGIVNPIPTNADEATGLQSALAVDDDAPEYEILGQLGAGNMGIVYHARQLSLNRELAIKTLKPNSTQAQHDQAMFVSEAVVTANLVHPNIIPIHDLGRTEDGKLFYSMKKVSGVAWNEIIRERSLEDNLDIYMKLCDAVAYAHSRGVINRDLKPENVVVGEFGEVIVLDWGLAITTDRFEKRRSVLVDFRGGAGTPVYMAPELLDEDLSRVGPASDVYLLGAILFEILEGFPPHLLKRIWQLTQPEQQFNAVYTAVMYNEIEQDVTHKGELMQIARKAMSTEAGDRFQSVEALQNAIREYRITGRAEELMNSVDSRSVSDYTIYQSAVALYGEALLKWPDNRRAAQGDRTARMAYAKLAQKKGDIDLGLEVVAQNRDPAFVPVIAKLKKTRLIRKIVRGTWGVTTVSAVSLLLYCWVLWMQAVEAKNEAVEVSDKLVAANGNLAEVTEKVKTANDEADAAKKISEEAIAVAEKATNDADTKVQQANEDVANATLIADKAKTDAADAEKAKIAAETDAKKFSVEAIKAQRMAQAESAAAEEAKKVAEQAQRAAAVALTEKFKYEYEGFTKQIEAAQQLSDFNEVIRIAKDALTKSDFNPLIKKNEVVLQKQIEAAEKSGGNVQIPLPNEPTSACISADGNTVVAYFGGLNKSIVAFKNVVSLNSNDTASQNIPVSLKGDIKIAVTNDGSCFCLATQTEKQFWTLRDNGQFQQVAADEQSTTTVGGRPLKKIFFAPNGEHFYAVANDKDATVEIYTVEPDSSKLILRQRLTGGDDVDFRIRDISLMPDESSLIVQFENQKCFEFRLLWGTDGTPKFDQNRLSRNAPAMGNVSIPGQPQVSDTPEKLFISPNGKKLGLVYSDTVVFLPRISVASANQFSFATPAESNEVELLRATYSVDLVQFSMLRGVPRVATGHKLQFLEIWDLNGKTYEPCQAEALFEHHLNNGLTAACLRGHSKDVKAFTFVGENGDRLVSVSSDKSIRTWQISTYAELARQIKTIRATFEQKIDQASVENPTFRRVVEFGKNEALSQLQSPGMPNASSQIGQSPIAQTLDYTLTAGPVTAEPIHQGSDAAEPRKITQGLSVFSARFSSDAGRFLVGADDLAAHALNSETGLEILTASMIGRKDLFFDPSRNMFLEGHVSEISTIQFVPPTGEVLLSADYFGSISAWDALPDENGVGFERSRLLSEYSFSEFAVSDDGSLILAGGANSVGGDGTLEEAKLLHKGVAWRIQDLLNSPSPAPFLELKDQHPNFAITAVAISPSASNLVTAGRRGKMAIWNAADGTVVASADGQHNSDQVSGIFFESETQLVSSGYDGKVFRSTIEGREMIVEPIPRSDGQIDPAFIIRMRASPDRTRFATSEVSLVKGDAGSKTGQLNVTIWSKEGTRILLTQPILIPKNDKELAFRHDVSWSSDGSKLMLVHDGSVGIFDTQEWKLLRKFNCELTGSRPVRGAFAPEVDARPFDRIATFDGRVSHMWDLPADGSVGVHMAEFRSHARYSVTASYSSDGKFVATASETLRVFDADENSPNHGVTMYRLPVGVVHHSPLADTAFSPAPNDLRLATIDHEGLLAIWLWAPTEPAPLQEVFQSEVATAEVPDWASSLNFGNNLSWSPDAKTLATLRKGVIALWTLDKENAVSVDLPLPEGIQCRFNQLQFSKKESLLTAGGVAWRESNGETFSFAAVWNTSTQTPKLISTIDKSDLIHTVDSQVQQRTGITAIAFDDKLNEIITGGVDGRLIRWQIAESTDAAVPSLTRIRDMLVDQGTKNPHQGMITAIDVSIAGQLLTGDSEGHLLLWPAPTE